MAQKQLLVLGEERLEGMVSELSRDHGFQVTLIETVAEALQTHADYYLVDATKYVEGTHQQTIVASGEDRNRLCFSRGLPAVEAIHHKYPNAGIIVLDLDYEPLKLEYVKKGAMGFANSFAKDVLPHLE